MLGVGASGYLAHWRKVADKPARPGTNKRISTEALLVHINISNTTIKKNTAVQSYGKNCWPVACEWAVKRYLPQAFL